MKGELLLDAEVHHLQDGLVGHEGLEGAVPLGGLLAVRKDVLADLGCAVGTQLADELDESLSSYVQLREVLVDRSSAPALRSLRKGVFLLTDLKNASSLPPLAFEFVHLYYI